MVRPAATQVGFRVSGGGERGLGHVYRSLAIAKYLQSSAEMEPYFLSNQDAAVQELVQASGFRQEHSGRAPKPGILPERMDLWVLDAHDDGVNLVSELRQRWPMSPILALDHFEYQSHQPDTIIKIHDETIVKT